MLFCVVLFVQRVTVCSSISGARVSPQGDFLQTTQKINNAYDSFSEVGASAGRLRTRYSGSLAFRPAARAMDRDDSNTSEDRFQVLLTYLAANAAELRQLCQDMASLLRTGEARRGKPAIPDRAALYRFLQRQGHAFTEGQREELRAWEARLCVSPKQGQPELQDQYERFPRAA